MSRAVVRSSANDPAPQALDRLAFSLWAFAVAVGVCIHEWQQAEPPVSLGGLTVVLAIRVLLKPSSVPRVMAVIAALALELLTGLPNVFNHTLVMGTVSVAILAWWLPLILRSPAVARDPGMFYATTAPFLRLAFVLVMYAAAFAKLNTGFLDPALTCAVWILDAVPLVTIPAGLAGVAIAGAILTEFAIPTLLLARRTRFLGLLVGIGFGVVTAAAGHAPFAGFAWSFYLLFIPPATLARVVATVRQAVPPPVRTRLTALAASPVGWLVPAAVALLVMGVLQVGPDALVNLARRYGASLAFCVYAGIWTVLLLRQWRHWFSVPGSGWGAVGTRHAVFVLTVVLILVNAASPYLGLKTRYSFTMFSNLQTEPGRWNHLVVPEAVRIFDLQQGVVRFGEISDGSLAAAVDDYSGRSRWSAGAATSDSAAVVLLAARRLATSHPDATVAYELDGRSRVAAPVASDPILGAPISLLTRVLGGFRPLEAADSCQL